MILFKIFDVAASFVLFTTVLSMTHRDVKNSFTVQQTPISYRKSGPAHVLSAYQRLKVTVPANLKAAAAVNSGTVDASPSEYDVNYLSPITIGGQTFNVAIDTGSDLLWVFSSKFPDANNASYNSSLSTTARKPQQRRWTRCYGDSGDSCVGGKLYIENVQVGGITYDNQIIGAVTRVTSGFQYPTTFDGIFGLTISRDSAGNLQKSTFFDNVKSELAAPLFTADLKKGQPGSYDLGFVDSSKYIGKITYVPVDASGGFWQFSLDGYAIGNGGINSISINSTSVNAIADTGTSIIMLSDQVVKNYYNLVPKASYSSTEFGYVFPCGTALPDFALVIGGYKAVVPGSFLEFAPTNSSGLTCFGGLQSVDGGADPLFILGDVFLKSQFVVFDVENDDPRIGFAAKAL